MNRVTLFVLLAAPLLPARTLAQAERFEVGQRLRAFENAWEAHKADAAHKRALQPLEQLIPLFFKGRLEEAARTLDLARHLLASDKERSPEQRWAEALSFRPATRFADTTLSELSVRVAPFYKVDVDAPKNAALELTLRARDGKALATARTAIDALPLEAKLPLRGIPEGDYTLEAKILAGDKVLAAPPGQTVAFADRLTDRVAALTKAVADLPAKSTVERATLRDQAELLGALAGKETRETNYPALRLLTEAEAVLKAAQRGKGYYGEGKTGQFWLRLPAGDKGVAVRLLAPEAVKQGKPLPLVVALHGAGGSENLFFEGYGAGEVVRQCSARGWLLVAPRSEGLSFNAPLAELVDEVNKLYPVDRQRVFVVGHSMGAMQAVGAAQQTPARFAAVAALGGGGFLQKGDALKALPFFVGVGGKDFMAGMVRTLKDGLTRAGAAVQFREYPDVDHLLVVRVALPEVFALFDKVAKK